MDSVDLNKTCAVCDHGVAVPNAFWTEEDVRIRKDVYLCFYCLECWARANGTTLRLGTWEKPVWQAVDKTIPFIGSRILGVMFNDFSTGMLNWEPEYLDLRRAQMLRICKRVLGT